MSAGPAHPAGAPSSGAPPQHGPRGGPGSLPVVVQAPALEALEAAPELSARQPPSAPAAPVSGHTPREAAVRPAEAAPPVPGAAGAAEPSERTVEHRGSRPHRPRKEAEVPRELMRELPVRPSDVCALGRRHGRWHPDSPEARICAGVREG
ncbi:hypothetical protein [Streptomyces sp. NBC_01408]|uniref:hypothetical protein n=1 Tax=Streptomyces sp. NBC_01408 TaxID=2903855 RepID=UPI0022503575|nr:hypothetical protein [Streptomyces sp. NBC_01408]MCX4694573.1 hypothetical protein [Streptomyces sp. NBC_01408]